MDSWGRLPIEVKASIFTASFWKYDGRTHPVVGVFFGILPLLLPIPFLGVGLFVACLQAFVFLLLTLVYLSGAMEHAH